MRLRRTRLPAISKRRASQRAAYRRSEAIFLEAHPYCQVTIFRWSLNEAQVIADNGTGWIGTHNIHAVHVPRATQVHHRNKARGIRLLDERWWMATCAGQHDAIEREKGWAREVGLLLPFEADENGQLPDGTICQTTDELLEQTKK